MQLGLLTGHLGESISSWVVGIMLVVMYMGR